MKRLRLRRAKCTVQTLVTMTKFKPRSSSIVQALNCHHVSSGRANPTINLSSSEFLVHPRPWSPDPKPGTVPLVKCVVFCFPFYQTSGALLYGIVTESFIMWSDYSCFTVEYLKAQRACKRKGAGYR